jgi:hypothetical protein
MLSSWRYPGLRVSCEPAVFPREAQAVENVTYPIIRASFSPESMMYVRDEAEVVYPWLIV